jgi:hypothetical protein
MSVVLLGSTSGSVTLQEPAVAGSTTINLPATSGTMAVLPTATSVLPEASGGTGTTTGYYGFKNRIINGGMVIDQRNAGASLTPSGQYTLDRWLYENVQLGKFTVQQNAGSLSASNRPVGFTNYLGITSTSAYSVLTGDTFLLNQRIEGYNVADFAFGTANAATITLSFWVRSSLTGTFGGSFVNGAGDRNYLFSYTISSANTWEQKTITIVGDTAGTWLTTNGIGLQVRFGLGSGSTYTGTANTWQAGNLVQPTGSVSVAGTNGATFYITGVQLEKGSTATSFDYRPYTTELQLCQRYLPYFGGIIGQNQSFGQCYSNTTTDLRCVISFPVPARATPTGLVASTASGFIGQMINSSNLTASAVNWASIASTTSQLISFTVSGATANQSGAIYNASAGYIYFTGCEL